MPFATSYAMFYYNKDLLKEAGLDPENPPRTYNEVKEAARIIVDKTDSYGFTTSLNGWFFEQLMANANALYLNNDNGWSSKPTESLVNQEEGLRIFRWFDEMYKEGTFKNFGGNFEDTLGPFLAGQVAMMLYSSAALVEIINNAPFEVGVTTLPVPDGKTPYGETVGGSTNYITNVVSQEKQKYAWEFIKYLTSPETQAKWLSPSEYN